jgi:branched-chain amino acid transport system ATP-binding protein
MTAPVLRLESLGKRYGGLVVTDDVSLDVGPGELHAIIGPNGAGKTTLINEISGLVSVDAGRILFEGHDISAMPAHARAAAGLARCFQITSVLPNFSALQNVALAAQARDGSSFRFFGRANDEERLNARARAALEEVGLATRADLPAGQLSHGEKRALELAIALALEPKMLLLDEPMAGTGHDETAMLSSVLRRLKGRFPMLLIEHDMSVVFSLADRVSVMVYGRILASGAPEAIRTDPKVVAAYLGEEAA